MADSNITKRALGESLKGLMLEVPFSKISVGEICERCSMNRKSFYYHFRDKYELVNWIFEREFIINERAQDNSSVWEVVNRLSFYLYNNKDFYKQAFMIDGQNSFTEYFFDYCKVTFANRIQDDGFRYNDGFQTQLMSEMLVSAFKYWILKNDALNGEQFSKSLKSTLECVSVKLYRDIYRLGQR